MYLHTKTDSHQPQCDGPSEETVYLTRKEKILFADKINTGLLTIPIIDATATPKPLEGFELVGAHVTRQGDLWTTIKTTPEAFAERKNPLWTGLAQNLFFPPTGKSFIPLVIRKEVFGIQLGLE